MGSEVGKLTKVKTISLHRAARRGLEAMGMQDGRIPKKIWKDYCIRATDVGTRMTLDNLNWRLEGMGLIRMDDEADEVIVLASDYSDIITDE
jgi:hypothetical protein